MTNIFENASSVVINNKEVQSIKIASNNAILYEKSSNNYELTVVSNKSILSYAHSENTTITATLSDSGETVTMKVYDSTQTNLLDTLTVTDNQDGTYSATYTATGLGDVIIVTEWKGLQETLLIEDCDYYNTNEVSRTSTNGSTIYDNNLSQSLTSNYEISLDIWSNHTSGGQHRFFLLPESQYHSNTTQPTNALWFDLTNGNVCSIGKRENNSSIGFTDSDTSVSDNTYYTIKCVKNGTTLEVYVDDVLKTTQTISWIDTYSDYTVSMMRWSSAGTSKIKNVKFKKL